MADRKYHKHTANLFLAHAFKSDTNMTKLSKAIKAVANLIAVLSLVLSAGQSAAHSPHDSIAFLAVSPAYEDDTTLFIGVLGHLQRSTDGGLTWKRLKRGLDNNSLMSSVAISPAFASDGIALAATLGDGVFESTDRGNSWRRLTAQPENRNLTQLVISPNFADDRTVLALGTEGGLYLSTNTGDSWETILDSDQEILSVAIVPDKDAPRVFAVLGNGETRQRSVTASEWQSVVALKNKAPYLLRSIQRSRSEYLLFVAADDATYASEDHGRTFQQSALPEGGIGGEPGRLTAADVKPNNKRTPELIVTAWHGGAYASDDGGHTWNATSQGLTKDVQANEYGHSHFRDIAVRGDTVFVSAFDGLFRSDDGGSGWFELESLPAKNPTSFDVAAGDGAGDRLAISTYDAGIYSSEDSGATWSSLNFGLSKTHVWSVAFRPNTPGESLLLATTNRSLYSRTNRDAAWQRNMLGCKGELERRSSFERAWDRVKYFFVDRSRCRATFPHQITFSPQQGDGGHIYFGTRYEGVFRSTDNGTTWLNVHDAFDGWVSRLATSPNQAFDHTVFATVRGTGILRSVDDGASWAQIADEEILDILSRNPLSPVPIAISPDVGSDGRVFAGTPSGLFESYDSGETWRQINVRQSGLGDSILAIALSPDFARDGFMLVSIKGHGLYASQDTAKTFGPIASDLIEANQVLTRIRFSDTSVYAMSEEEFFASTDRGNSWHVISRPARYESTSDAMIIHGNWSRLGGEHFSGTSAIASAERGAYLELGFQGTEAMVVTYSSPGQGIAAVYIDGALAGKIDLYSAKTSVNPTLTRFPGLTDGAHKIRIDVTGERAPASGGSLVIVDAIETR